MKHAFLVLLLLTPSATIAQEPPDPRGPIVNPGMEPRVTAEGVFAAGYRFAPSKDAGLWPAPWIWLDPPAGAGEAIAATFRKTVMLPATPTSVRARISADIVYRLWVNGQLVSRGPADPGNDYSPRTRWWHQWLYDVHNLTLRQSGPRSQARMVGARKKWWPMAPAFTQRHTLSRRRCAQRRSVDGSGERDGSLQCGAACSTEIPAATLSQACCRQRKLKGAEGTSQPGNTGKVLLHGRQNPRRTQMRSCWSSWASRSRRPWPMIVWSRQTGHCLGRRSKGITPGRCCLSPLAVR